jgi:hypothetical protein
MATVKQALHENDVVELLDSIGQWPAGRLGAIVSDYGDVKLVEIADEKGVMLDLIQVAEPRLKLISKHSA